MSYIKDDKMDIAYSIDYRNFKLFTDKKPKNYLKNDLIDND